MLRDACAGVTVHRLQTEHLLGRRLHVPTTAGAAARMLRPCATIEQTQTTARTTWSPGAATLVPARPDDG